ncbi:hypothetical protein BU16DRAFT_617247 [Lophium mytilinum]|uniref:T6SS Phospholipase effector Tle1-like catalytic domain-containing protein n=1 Tax=Lophium mytilinum TaxID=390894 RepID=A0A6A6QYA3_9PEZI|nr:hypothetical protein BU16DRAFT_617247 [Lophium mytilinum]
MKRLFVCCDGTSCDATQGEHEAITNVARFARCVKTVADDKKTLQLVYYHKGPVNWITGSDIHDIIQDAYHFICQNYDFDGDGDEIHLVGFSRGAFAVRALACFIADVGLFRKTGLAFLPGTYKLWRKSNEKLEERESYKEYLDPLLTEVTGEEKPKLIQGIAIQSCAVWDTVSNLKDPLKKGHRLQNAFQALALNEDSYEFLPVLWKKPDPGLKSENSETERESEKADGKSEEKKPEQPRIKQCWFRGNHSDIGGGYADSGLATLSLLWMVAQFKAFLPNVSFDDDILTDFMTPMSLKWTTDSQGRETYTYKSHNATKGAVHNTPNLFRLSLRGLTSDIARKSLFESSATLHSTVRILMKLDARTDRGKKNVLLEDYHPEIYKENGQRARWCHNLKGNTLEEDCATKWESDIFHEWLIREHDWRKKHSDDNEEMRKSFAAKLYPVRNQMEGPHERTMFEAPQSPNRKRASSEKREKSSSMSRTKSEGKPVKDPIRSKSMQPSRKIDRPEDLPHLGKAMNGKDGSNSRGRLDLKDTPSPETATRWKKRSNSRRKQDSDSPD